MLAKIGRWLAAEHPEIAEPSQWTRAALHGTYVRVLDAAMRPVARGAADQLFAVGEGLARRYLNRPGPTAEPFRPDPLGGPGARLYTTGLSCVNWPTGNSSRRTARPAGQDPGLPLELGETEAELRRHTAVRDVVVAATGATGDVRCLSVFLALERTAYWGRRAASQARTPAAVQSGLRARVILLPPEAVDDVPPADQCDES
ncbi:hypothetical protein ACH4UM_12955 [Streptomyces sp. NPDC020801]|uniref:hypothetical protein n=1 Tax=unclassified Streptomyces TaxID=2593676 RepID=UPI0037B253AF